MRAVSELRRRETTVVIVTHKLSLLAEADWILVMGGGRVQAFGTAEEILAQVAGPRATPSLAPVTGLESAADRRLQDRPRAATG